MSLGGLSGVSQQGAARDARRVGFKNTEVAKRTSQTVKMAPTGLKAVVNESKLSFVNVAEYFFDMLHFGTLCLEVVILAKATLTLTL